MEITVLTRPAQTGDIPRMCDLLAELFSIESDFAPDREKQARGLNQLLNAQSESSLVLVAVHGETVIGMATVQTLISTAEGGRVGLVEDVVVDRQFRNQGVGTLLLEGVVAWCREKGLSRLQLLADHENRPAIVFYKLQGWGTTSLICMWKML